MFSAEQCESEPECLRREDSGSVPVEFGILDVRALDFVFQ